MKFFIASLFAVLHAARALVAEGNYIRVPLGPSTCNAFAYGAAGDGHTDDTKALQAAINACAKGLCRFSYVFVYIYHNIWVMR